MFYVLFVCKCVLPPGDNPIAVNKYIIIIYQSYHHIVLLTGQEKCSKLLNYWNMQSKHR